MVSAIDQRRAPRVPAHAAIRYVSGRLALHGTVYNLSVGGAFVVSSEQDEPGTVAELELRCPSTTQELLVSCRVVHRRQQPVAGMGVEFLEPDTRTVRELERYCSMFEARGLVLMVDDDPPILRMMSRILRHEGVGFVGIDVPVKTEATIERFEPQLVILDITMPEVDGLTLARRLRATPKTREVPLLFHSATPQEWIPSDLRDVPFLPKGSSRDELVATVMRQLERTH